MFLVMLILTKSTSEQRESRFEGLIVKKRVAREGSTAVYNMKMAEAEATYKTEEKQAEIKKIVGIVSIVAGAVSIVGGVFSGIAKNTAIAQKLGEVISEKVLTNISRYGAVVAQLISTVCTDSASLYQGIATLDLAEIRKNAAFVSAETKQTQAFFERAMKEIGDMQEAYGNSQREISTTLKSMQEALEKKQETRLSVARNI
jgi:hypothetical protein